MNRVRDRFSIVFNDTDVTNGIIKVDDEHERYTLQFSANKIWTDLEKKKFSDSMEEQTTYCYGRDIEERLLDKGLEVFMEDDK